MSGRCSSSRFGATPEVGIPVVIVATSYAGAGPDEVESEITLELEEELNSIDDLRHLSSVSREGVSTQFLEFEDRTDLRFGVLDPAGCSDHLGAFGRLGADALRCSDPVRNPRWNHACLGP